MYRCRVPSDKFQQIFISHLHGDHVFGLIGLLTSFCLKKRTAKLELFAPPGLRELVEHTARLTGVVFPYELVFHEVDAAVSKLVFENKHVSVHTIPLEHRGNCTGWLFREKPKPLNIRKEKIAEYAISVPEIKKIKGGGDLILPDGRVIRNGELTLPPTAPRAYAFCSDTAPSDTVADIVLGVDLLYHEATFTDEHLEEARLSCHSTARQAAEIARAAKVKNLLLGHFSGRYTDLERHLTEAGSVFPETTIAVEGGVYAI